MTKNLFSEAIDIFSGITSDKVPLCTSNDLEREVKLHFDLASPSPQLTSNEILEPGSYYLHLLQNLRKKGK